MSHRPADCSHVWNDWKYAMRYVGKPELEPCMARTCRECHKREEVPRVLDEQPDA